MASKKWPTNHDLLTWFLYDRLSDADPEGPEDIGVMIDEYERSSVIEIHAELYDTYSEFAELFFSPADWETSDEEKEEETTAEES